MLLMLLVCRVAAEELVLGLWSLGEFANCSRGERAG